VVTAHAFLALCALASARIPSVDDAFMRHGPAIVGVRAGPAGAEVDSTGFLLTSSGLVATVMLPAERAQVTFADGAVRQARVVARDSTTASGLARDGALTLLAIERAAPDDMFAALAVRSKDAPKKLPAWWLGITFAEGRAVPALGGLRRMEAGGRLRLDVPAGPGAPVLVNDEVVAVVIQRVDQTSSIAIDVSALLALAKTLTPAPQPPSPAPR
jgi:hypothetical protein